MNDRWEIWVLEVDGPRMGCLVIMADGVLRCDAVWMARSMAHAEWGIPAHEIDARVLLLDEDGGSEDMGWEWAGSYALPVPVVVPEGFTLPDVPAGE